MYAKKAKGQKTTIIHGPMRDKKVLKEIRKRRSKRVRKSEGK